MGAKVFFSLERIPSRYGRGEKAKMKRREPRIATRMLAIQKILGCLQRIV